jgi:UPF0716 family protein affecting phage T7 exclusion
MEEKIFLNNGKVMVSNSRFVVEGQTYAISNITSVTSGKTEGKQFKTIIFLVIGLVLLTSGTVGILIGLFLLVAAFRNVDSLKTTYTVILNTSAGENKALSSHDQAYVSTIIAALNDAIVSRG